MQNTEASLFTGQPRTQIPKDVGGQYRYQSHETYIH